MFIANNFGKIKAFENVEMPVFGDDASGIGGYGAIDVLVVVLDRL